MTVLAGSTRNINKGDLIWLMRRLDMDWMLTVAREWLHDRIGEIDPEELSRYESRVRLISEYVAEYTISA